MLRGYVIPPDWFVDTTGRFTTRSTESANLQFRADFLNLFKHYNPDPNTVVNALNSKTFGTIAGGVSGGYAIRVIQLAAKLYF